ncbi:MAG: hypothetical protein M1839_008511 [Geoglossum umbratile]|nr:MAG: hypothetical protein M1839_008511 [Geoglossum umbratile]
MGLIDLPTELLELIICYSIDKHWTALYEKVTLGMRRVCRKFNSIVSYYALQKAKIHKSPLKFGIQQASYGTLVWLLAVKAMVYPKSDINLIAAMNASADLMATLTAGDFQISRESIEYWRFLYVAARAATFYQGKWIVYQLDRSDDLAAGLVGGYENALSVAAFSGNEQLVGLLLANGADVNACHHFGPPLCAAASENHQEIVRLLLDAGADINIVGRGNLVSALSEAADRGHVAMMQLLIDKGSSLKPADTGCDFMPLQLAILRMHEEAVKLLLINKVDVNGSVWVGSTPILFAVMFNRVPIVRILLAHPDIQLQGDHGLLSEAKSEGVLQLLLSSQAVCKRVEDVNRALLTAIKDRKEAIVQMLLEEGVDWSGGFGWALHSAARAGHEGIVKLLLAKGAENFTARDDDGHTPLSWAQSQGHEAVERLLLDAMREAASRGRLDWTTSIIS